MTSIQKRFQVKLLHARNIAVTLKHCDIRSLIRCIPRPLSSRNVGFVAQADIFKQNTTQRGDRERKYAQLFSQIAKQRRNCFVFILFIDDTTVS